MGRLDDAGHFQPEFLQQVPVPVMDGDDPRNLRLGELLRGLRFDEAQTTSVVGGVPLQRGRILRTQRRDRLLNRIGLLNRVGEGDEGVRVDAGPAHRVNLRRRLVGPDDDDPFVAGCLEHRHDEVVVADAVDDDRIEVDELLDVIRPGLIVAGVDFARKNRSHLVPGQVADDVPGPREVWVKRDANLQRGFRLGVGGVPDPYHGGAREERHGPGWPASHHDHLLL